MRTQTLVVVAAIAAFQAVAADKRNPMDIAGSRLGISKAEVTTNATTAPVGYGNVRQGLESLTYLMASAEVVIDEQGAEYGSAVQPSSDNSKASIDKAKTDKTKTDKPKVESTPAPQATLPAGTVTKSVYKTFYFDKFGRVVAIQMSFENLNGKDLAELLRSLDEKYIKDVQKQTDIYTYSLSNFVKLESRVRPTAFRPLDGGHQQAIRFQVINLYYDESRLQKTVRDANERNTLKFKEFI